MSPAVTDAPSATDVPLAPDTTRTLTSDAFGSIEVHADAVMRFVEPLWGFADHTEYALLPAARHGLWWLLSLTDSSAVFVLADPFVMQSEYVIDLGDAEKAALEIEADTDAIALVMMTLPSQAGEEVTANFRAPIIVNVRQRLAMQIVNRDEASSMRQRVDLTVYPPQAHGLSLS